VRNNKWRVTYRGADSKWEGVLRDGVLSCCEHHPEKLPYIIHHNYTPDFKTKDKKYIIEAKGRFMDSAEASKYKWIRKSLPKHIELVFLFMKPNTPMPHAKARKDGTKRTHAEWAEKNNFKWYDETTIKEIL
jgi:hypothetical protein